MTLALVILIPEIPQATNEIVLWPCVWKFLDSLEKKE